MIDRGVVTPQVWLIEKERAALMTALSLFVCLCST